MAANKHTSTAPTEGALEIVPSAASDMASSNTATEPTPMKKRDALIAMLRTDEGASVEEMSDTFGWLQHSTRAMLTSLRKAGHSIERSKNGSVTVYKLVA